MYVNSDARSHSRPTIRTGDASNLKAGEAAAAFMLEMMSSLADTAHNDDQQGEGNEDVRWSHYSNRLMRHFKSWNGQGETFDQGSNCTHLAHVAALAMVLWTLERDQAGCDDRPATRAEQLLMQLRDGL